MQTDHQFTGMQFDPQSIANIVVEIDRQKKAKRDFIYPAKALGFTDAGELELKATQGFRVGDIVYTEWGMAEAAADQTGSSIVPVGDVAPLHINGPAFTQLRGVLGIPAIYSKSLSDRGHADLLAYNVRELLQRDDRRFLVRTTSTPEGEPYVRAILSDRYRVLDNDDLFYAAAETFHEIVDGKPRAELWKARLSQNGFQMFGVAPHISGEVRLDRPFDPGDGWTSRWYGKAGDIHNAALLVSNSETGHGGLNIDFAIMRRVCFNFNIYSQGIAKIHLGKTQGVEGLILSDETRESASKTFWLTIRDAIRTAFDVGRFEALIARLNEATQQVLPNPSKAVDNVVEEFAISQDRKDAILASLLGSGDVSRFGLIQAVTASAHAAEGQDVDEAGSLEYLGGKLAEMADDKFASLVK